MSEDEIRKEFEALISASPFKRDVTRFPDEPTAYAWPGSYMDDKVHLAWNFYLAGRNAALEAAAKRVIEATTREDAVYAIRAMKEAE